MLSDILLEAKPGLLSKSKILHFDRFKLFVSWIVPDGIIFFRNTGKKVTNVESQKFDSERLDFLNATWNIGQNINLPIIKNGKAKVKTVDNSKSLVKSRNKNIAFSGLWTLKWLCIFQCLNINKCSVSLMLLLLPQLYIHVELL